MSLISELKRRNVFRVATAYVIVGWLVLQVADVVLDFADAPGWIGKVLIALLAIGFPVALVLSWLFDATPDGIRRDDGSSAVDPVRAQRLNILAVVAAIGVAAMFAWQQMSPAVNTASDASQSAASTDARVLAADSNGAPDADASAASIAVLPFADLSPDGDQEYFSDGIAEEILNVLTRVDGLEVASRTSAFAFKGRQELGIPAIGDALRVRHVLEGSVRSAGETIRITAQLIDASTDKHLWSQTYDRQLTAENVFEIQDEIASAIVAELAKSLPVVSAAAVAVGVKADTQNLDAYQLFLQGRQRFRVRSVNNIPATIDIFEKAVELDPQFARAWAGLAAVMTVAPSWGIRNDGENYYVLAERAARRAIQLDDSLALPYAVLAYRDREALPRDYARSFGLLNEALERDPKEVNALLWRGIDRIAVGQFDEAIADLERCSELDSNYQNCVAFRVQAHLFNGDYDAAKALYFEVAASNSPSQAIMTAYAMVQREDRLTAMLALAWSIGGFDSTLKPELVYRAIKDPDFDPDSEWRAFAASWRALNGREPELEDLGSLLALLFDRFELMRPSPFNALWWHPSFPDFLASPHRNRLIREMGIYDYWLESGFPPQCRPLGDDDFECD